MKCQECEELLHPYLDGEMDAAQRAAVDEHLKSCDDCRLSLEHLQMLKRALQMPELRYTASDVLRHKIKTKLREADARARRPAFPRLGAAAAAALIAVALVWNFMPHGPGTPRVMDDDAMVDSAVDQQQLAAKSGHFTDYASSNPSTLQRWFGHKLAYVPPVPDLRAQGYTLLGARVDKVGDEPAAALVYLRGSDMVTVFVCHAQHGDKALDTDSNDGYQVAYCTKGSLSFWVVSKQDLSQVKQVGAALQTG